MPESHHDPDENLRPDPFLEVSWSGKVKKKKRRRSKRSNPTRGPNWISATEQFSGQNAGHLDASGPTATPLQAVPGQQQASPAQQATPQAAPQPTPANQPNPYGTPPAQTTARPPQRPAPPPLPRTRSNKGSKIPLKVLPFAIGLVLFALFSIIGQFASDSSDNSETIPSSGETSSPSDGTINSQYSPQPRYKDGEEPESIDYEINEKAELHGQEFEIIEVTTMTEAGYEFHGSDDQGSEALLVKTRVLNTNDFESSFYINLGWSDGDSYFWDYTSVQCDGSQVFEHDPNDVQALPAGETLELDYCIPLPPDIQTAETSYLWGDDYDEIWRWEIPAGLIPVE